MRKSPLFREQNYGARKKDPSEIMNEYNKNMANMYREQREEWKALAYKQTNRAIKWKALFVAAAAYIVGGWIF